MDVEDQVRDHYSRSDLEVVVLDALKAAGVDVDVLTVEDLGGIDHLHAGSMPATLHLLEALDLGPGSAVLDVGCGVGGPARLAAHRYGCPVTGIDLSPDFVDLARRLTERVGLAASVTFDEGSATALPYADAAFDRAMMNHVGMNIPDKAGVFSEVRRVLSDGGRFALYEQVRIGEGELTFPMPWADDARSSFVDTAEHYEQLLRSAGFVLERSEDRAAALAAGGPPAAGELTPADLFGPDFDVRIHNNIVATMNGILCPMLFVASAA